MTLQTLKSARSGAWFLNLAVGPGLAIYILATLGVARVLGFVLLWVVTQAAWGSLTNVLETAALASVSRGRMAELDTDPSGVHLPGRLSGAMLLWVLGTIAMPWLAALFILLLS